MSSWHTSLRQTGLVSAGNDQRTGRSRPVSALGSVARPIRPGPGLVGLARRIFPCGDQQRRQELMRRERNGRYALPGCFAGASALEHAARTFVAQRGELPVSELAARADGDQQLGSVVQILPDLATAAAMALPNAVAPTERDQLRLGQ